MQRCTITEIKIKSHGQNDQNAYFLGVQRVIISWSELRLEPRLRPAARHLTASINLLNYCCRFQFHVQRLAASCDGPIQLDVQ